MAKVNWLAWSVIVAVGATFVGLTIWERKVDTARPQLDVHNVGGATMLLEWGDHRYMLGPQQTWSLRYDHGDELVVHPTIEKSSSPHHVLLGGTTALDVSVGADGAVVVADASPPSAPDGPAQPR